MEITKLLKVLEDILSDDEEYYVQNSLVELLGLINNRNDENAINECKENIFNELEESCVNNFVQSDIKILKEINGLNFYGAYCKNEIEKILQTPYGIEQKLQEFIDKRNKFLRDKSAFKKSIEDNGFNPHYYTKEEDFEIGFLIPSNINSLEEIKNEIEFFDRLLGDLLELEGKERKNQVSLLNNGSWEIFIISTFVIANQIIKFVKGIFEIIKEVEEIKDLKEKTKYLKNKNIEKEFKAEERKAWNVFLDKSIKEVLGGNKKNESEGRKNELKTL